MKEIRTVLQLLQVAFPKEGQNMYSSRSHAIIQVLINKKTQGKSIESKLLLVDLAGSEKLSGEEAKRKTEGKNINLSLFSLGKCINILCDKEKRDNNLISFRESKLIYILKDSLIGNTHTLMIACVSQNLALFEETLSTLKYASNARNIENKVFRNNLGFQKYNSRRDN